MSGCCGRASERDDAAWEDCRCRCYWSGGGGCEAAEVERGASVHQRLRVSRERAARIQIDGSKRAFHVRYQ